MITSDGITPPGGWKYTQKESGFAMTSITLSDLKRQIETHRVANDFDHGPGWWEEVQMELCLDPYIEEHHCQPDTTYREPEVRRLKIMELLKFFRAFREWVMKHGFEKAPEEQVNERAAICATCPLNVKVKGCSGCQGVGRWLAEFLGQDKEVPQGDKLQNCEVCGCVLKLKIYMPEEAIKAVTSPEEDYPDHCWMPK